MTITRALRAIWATIEEALGIGTTAVVAMAATTGAATSGEAGVGVGEAGMGEAGVAGSSTAVGVAGTLEMGGTGAGNARFLNWQARSGRHHN